MQRLPSLPWLLVLTLGPSLGPLQACSGRVAPDDGNRGGVPGPDREGDSPDGPDWDWDWGDGDLPNYCNRRPPEVCSGDAQVVSGDNGAFVVAPPGGLGEGGAGGQGGAVAGGEVIVRFLPCFPEDGELHVSPGQTVSVVRDDGVCETDGTREVLVADATGLLDVEQTAQIIIPAAEFECLSWGSREARCRDALDAPVK